MQVPTVVHPKLVLINKIRFEVVSYEHLTDDQAYRIALNYFRAGKLPKVPKGKVLRVFDLSGATS